MKLFKQCIVAGSLALASSFACAASGVHFTNNTAQTFTPECSVSGGATLPAIIHIKPNSDNITLNWVMLKILGVKAGDTMNCDFVTDASPTTPVYHADITVGPDSNSGMVSNTSGTAYNVTITPNDGKIHDSFVAVINNA